MEEKDKKENTALRAPRGTMDVLPPDSERWRVLTEHASRLFRDYGYREIILPVMEHTELFARGIGEGSDIVQKEMFVFQDKGGRSLALRPEATAGVVRAFIQHRMETSGLPVKLFYQGPMFRHERPQAGRLRQFHQLGVELIGSSGASADAEVIVLCSQLLEDLGVDARLVLNSVGDRDCRPAYLESLREYLAGMTASLCADCRRRMETNPLRVMDCKEERCAEVISGAPSLREHLCAACREHLEQVTDLLGDAGVPFTLDERLVRGLDYYTRTVFEFQDPEMGAQNALAAGGRYDHLVEELGGRPTPAVGFSIGVERVMLAGPRLVEEEKKGIYVVAIGEEARRKAFCLAVSLRREGMRADLDHLDRSPKAQMRDADRGGFRFCLILGEEEMGGGFLTLRDMSSGEQERVEEGRLLEELAERLSS